MELVQSRNMQVARDILRVLAAVEGPRLMVESYVNGREQGYSVSNYHVTVSFSVARYCDAVSVMFGKTSDFSMAGNILRDYNRSTCAGWRHFNTPMEAAEFIVKFFRDHPWKFEVAGTDENERFIIGAESDYRNQT